MSSVCEDRLKQGRVVLRRTHSLDAIANHRLSKAILSWWPTDLVTRWPTDPITRWLPGDRGGEMMSFVVCDVLV